MTGMDYGPDRTFLRARAAATNLAAERSPFGHPLPDAEIRAAQAGVDATLTVLREAGLLAPAPLREEPRSEHTVQETAAYFARRVQRVGDRISDRGYRRSLVDVVALETVQGFLDRIARDDLDVYAADAVDRAEGDGRAESHE